MCHKLAPCRAHDYATAETPEGVMEEFHPGIQFEPDVSDDMPEETAGESEYEPMEMRRAA